LLELKIKKKYQKANLPKIGEPQKRRNLQIGEKLNFSFFKIANAIFGQIRFQNFFI